MRFTPEISAASIIVIGDFSPIRIQPYWLAEKGIIDSEELEAVAIEIICDEAVQFSIDKTVYFVDRSRFQIHAMQEPLIKVYDIAMALFSVIEEQPVAAIGLNKEAHVRLKNVEQRHRLGDLLAPREAWGEFALREGKQPAGLRTLTMERPRVEPLGHVQMTVAPSLPLGEPGVYFGMNDHYDLRLEGKLSSMSAALDVVASRWHEAMSLADRIRERLLDTVR